MDETRPEIEQLEDGSAPDLSPVPLVYDDGPGSGGLPSGIDMPDVPADVRLLPDP